MSRTNILWLALAGWTIAILVLFAQKQYEEAAPIWDYILEGVWLVGALPLFIAAVVTRKDKAKEETNSTEQQSKIQSESEVDER